jgi:uncharacterized membrane protein YhdT
MEGRKRFTVGDVVGKSFGLWMALIGPLTLLNAAIVAPAGLLLLVDFEDPDMLSLIFTLWQSLAGVVVAGAIAKAVVFKLHKEPVTFGDAIATGFAKLPALLGMAIVLAAPVAVVGVVIMILSFVFLPIGLLLLVVAVVPLIIYYVAHAVAGAALVVENLPIMNALERSRKLTKDRRMPVFGAMLVIGLCVNIITGIAAAVFGGLGDPTSVEEARKQLSTSLVMTILFGPLGAVANAVIYHDLRVEKEGVRAEDLMKVFG